MSDYPTKSRVDELLQMSNTTRQLYNVTGRNSGNEVENKPPCKRSTTHHESLVTKLRNSQTHPLGMNDSEVIIRRKLMQNSGTRWNESNYKQTFNHKKTKIHANSIILLIILFIIFSGAI